MTVNQLVMHEVHRPHFIDGKRHAQRLWRLPHQALPRLDAQVQFQLAVNPVNALMVTQSALNNSFYPASEFTLPTEVAAQIRTAG